MDLFITKLVSSILQILLFTAIPFVWWLVTARKKQGFLAWIGLKKITGGRKTRNAVLVVSVAFLFLSVFMLSLLKGVETATSEFDGLGVHALPAIVVYALFNTSLPEEILFRGFLLKRLANRFGFVTANVIQAIVFGLLHGAMFVSLTGALKTVVIIAFTATIAWFMGFINEKNADGSILPSWIIHAISNLFSGLFAAFSIL